MASKSCSSCLRTIYRQSRSIGKWQTAIRISSRAFTTTQRRRVELPEPNATPATSIPPVTPQVGEGGPKTTSPALEKVASGLRKLTGNSIETYTAYGGTETLYKECASQAQYSIPQASSETEEMPQTAEGEDLGVGEGWWFNELGLTPTFSTWSQVTMLHMYLIAARIRCFEPDISKPWQQHLLDHFFYDAENKMTINHNMHARGTRNKYLKDLFLQWRGLLAAYDEGLMKGDAVLAAAVWRNIFHAREDVDIKKLSLIVSYMRKNLQGLDALSDERIMQGTLKFGNPSTESKLVGLKSPMMDKPFGKPPLKGPSGKPRAPAA